MTGLAKNSSRVLCWLKTKSPKRNINKATTLRLISTFHSAKASFFLQREKSYMSKSNPKNEVKLEYFK